MALHQTLNLVHQCLWKAWQLEHDFCSRRVCLCDVHMIERASGHRDDPYRWRWSTCSDPTTEIETIQVGQLDVADDYVWYQTVLDEGDRVQPARCLGYAVARHTEEERVHFACVMRVINEEHRRPRWGREFNRGN
jgi:hypothetical protein